MELFLLLSIGLSIVAFISIALNQSPPNQPIKGQHSGAIFPLESYILKPQKMPLLQLDSEMNDSEVEKIANQHSLNELLQPVSLQGEITLSSTEL